MHFGGQVEDSMYRGHNTQLELDDFQDIGRQSMWHDMFDLLLYGLYPRVSDLIHLLCHGHCLAHLY